MQEKYPREFILFFFACGACSPHSRQHRKIVPKNNFQIFCRNFGGIHFGANTCCACIRTRANTGTKILVNYLVLVSCQGVHIAACDAPFFWCPLAVPKKLVEPVLHTPGMAEKVGGPKQTKIKGTPSAQMGQFGSILHYNPVRNTLQPENITYKKFCLRN